jgi:hypothetical protein
MDYTQVLTLFMQSYQAIFTNLEENIKKGIDLNNLAPCNKITNYDINGYRWSIATGLLAVANIRARII